jgi:LytS/YehU family sensor histidine kinase
MSEMLKHVITAVATAAVLGIAASVMGVFEKGVAAADAEQIRAVLNEQMQTDAGLTYGQALSQIALDINTVSTQVSELKTDVDDLEDAVLTLAGE